MVVLVVLCKALCGSAGIGNRHQRRIYLYYFRKSIVERKPCFTTTNFYAILATPKLFYATPSSELYYYYRNGNAVS